MKKVLIIIVLLIAAIVCGLYLFFRGNSNIQENDSIERAINESNSDYENYEGDDPEDADKVYSISNKDFNLYDNTNEIDEEYSGMKLLEYDVYKDYDEIYYILYDYTTDPTYEYYIKFEDESNNNLLLKNEEQRIIGGVISRAKIKKQDLKSKINVSIFEKNIDQDKIENGANVKIDLEKDLEEFFKIDNSENLQDGTLENISFKYVDSENLYYGTTEHSYSNRLTGEIYSIPVKLQYGNRLVSEEHIEFSFEKNVNNLSLEEAYESLSLINENFGQFGLSDIYGLRKIDSKEDDEEIIIDFDEMIDLCKGKSIEKNGEVYSKESFERYSEMPMEKDGNVVIGNGINAIKYYFESNKESSYYMFINDDNIFYISIPLNKRLTAETQNFLNNLDVQK